MEMTLQRGRAGYTVLYVLIYFKPVTNCDDGHHTGCPGIVGSVGVTPGLPGIGGAGFTSVFEVGYAGPAGISGPGTGMPGAGISGLDPGAGIDGSPGIAGTEVPRALI